LPLIARRKYEKTSIPGRLRKMGQIKGHLGRHGVKEQVQNAGVLKIDQQSDEGTEGEPFYFSSGRQRNGVKATGKGRRGIHTMKSAKSKKGQLRDSLEERIPRGRKNSKTLGAPNRNGGGDGKTGP